MMYSYPFYSFPRLKRYPSYYGSNLSIHREQAISSTIPRDFSNHVGAFPKSYQPTLKPSSHIKSINKDKKNTRKSVPQNIKKDTFCDTDKNVKSEKNDDVLFEIFGLKLFYDDVLLICLIFFLYQEGVEDQYLFIALILLLLS